MSQLQIIVAVISAIVLFLYGLEGFSRELRTVGGEKLQSWLARVTANRFVGFFIGASATVLIQSSAAVISLTASLVDAAVLSFRSSLGILLGANLGTTTTAWLVSFKLTGIGPYFIVLGTLLSILPTRAKLFGKTCFYFGLIFFTLDLISVELRPLQQQPWWNEVVSYVSSPMTGLLIGTVFTAAIQSSTVAIGLAVILVQQGMMQPDAAIFFVIGSNLGSTSTALIACLSMNQTAKATAVANFSFNIISIVLLFPWLRPFAQLMLRLSEPTMAVALAHLSFNILLSTVFLLVLPWSHRILVSVLKLPDPAARPG
ncbi:MULTISPECIES: Na/Pi cotransporter family protein [unclassified Herbaspirillum]|uniref:Na/Pi cotransporter family protein n=1 Tax=unclassified Herbaspirillum TaxID=2624150 RepID=UPI0011526642|nr:MULTISPECIES: Na/Pi symporter [unclassified Herbaspirillum]MBB5392277.1 Na/Pi-cotransporter [Herbaspirillum sp. SJZ102]TQK05919.1 Na/Pi-cotransporter [Herbaspirillum sp. SJZ130]TQK12603.1 Na/Pi-cotransporter [Herbaspirillum sp. SJZ106]TWC68139.1 Na/Pi-cotransporter [Herbaspirillum sp. SJZ099]